jgi:hypothetical protein
MTLSGLIRIARHYTLVAFQVLAVAAGIASISACETPQERVTHREDNLAAAGFVIRPANTPERRAMLAKLPAHHFVRRQKNDTVYYVYADPLVCGCLYVGSQQAYGNYRDQQRQQHLVDEQQMTAVEYSDNAWNWGAWGPWGPEYSFGYGSGW